MSAPDSRWIKRLIIDSISALIRIAFQQSGLPVRQPVDRYKEQVFHFQRNSFDDYFVVQRAGIDPATGWEFPSADEDIGDGFTLRTVAIRKLSPVYWIRLSRASAVDEAKIRAWAGKEAQEV